MVGREGSLLNNSRDSQQTEIKNNLFLKWVFLVGQMMHYRLQKWINDRWMTPHLRIGVGLCATSLLLDCWFFNGDHFFKGFPVVFFVCLFVLVWFWGCCCCCFFFPRGELPLRQPFIPKNSLWGKGGSGLEVLWEELLLSSSHEHKLCRDKISRLDRILEDSAWKCQCEEKIK